APAVFTVLNPLDAIPVPPVGSLRWAINQANTTAGNDTINFDGSMPPIVLASELVVNDPTGGDLYIHGQGQAATTVSGNNLVRVMRILGSPNGAATIDDLTIKDGKRLDPLDPNGAGIHSQNRLTLQNVLFQNNQALGNGGGVYEAGAFAH